MRTFPLLNFQTEPCLPHGVVLKSTRNDVANNSNNTVITETTSSVIAISLLLMGPISAFINEYVMRVNTAHNSFTGIENCALARKLFTDSESVAAIIVNAVMVKPAITPYTAETA